MPRIRSIKPEFWEDEAIALLSRDARLLFISCWNFADDEGLLRWTSAYLKANAFMYDNDVTPAKVQKWMDEIVQQTLVFPYSGGKTQQKLGWIPKFHRHQRVNRPQASKLPPPSLQNPRVIQMYAERDGWACHLCGIQLSPDRPSETDPSNWISADHVTPRSQGGSDYPSNIRLAHVLCNKRRGASSVPPSVNESVNESLNDSVLVMEGVGEGGGVGEGVGLAPKARERNLLFDALADVCQIDPSELTDSYRGAFGKAVKDLVKVGATPDEVHRRAENWPSLFPQATLTPPALAKHWAQLARARAPAARPDRFVDMARSLNDRMNGGGDEPPGTGSRQTRRGLPA